MVSLPVFSFSIHNLIFTLIQSLFICHKLLKEVRESFNHKSDKKKRDQLVVKLFLLITTMYVQIINSKYIDC